MIGQVKYSKLNKELDKISISNFIEFFSICLRCKWNYAKFTETLKFFLDRSESNYKLKRKLNAHIVQTCPVKA